MNPVAKYAIGFVLLKEMIILNDKKDMIYSTIGRDTYYITTANVFNFSIRDEEGNIIFRGKSYPAPDSTSVKVKVNAIVSDFVKSDISEKLEEYNTTKRFGNAYVMPDYAKTFDLLDEFGTIKEQFTFINDWSGEEWDHDVKECSHPIDGFTTDNMLTLRNNLGTNGMTVSNDNPIYNKVGCGKYALIYENLYGAYDSFLIQGSVKKKDSFNRLAYTKSYDNRTLQRGRNEYLNEITRSWELTTSILTDEQSDILSEHLLSSPDVYLHDLVKNEIIPVVITDTSADYKHYTNDEEMVTYVINVKEAQNKIRQ